MPLAKIRQKVPIVARSFPRVRTLNKMISVLLVINARLVREEGALQSKILTQRRERCPLLRIAAWCECVRGYTFAKVVEFEASHFIRRQWQAMHRGLVIAKHKK